MTPQRSFGRALAIAGILFIAVLTLQPEYGTPEQPLSLCLLCGDTPVLDAVLNICLFIPFGMGLRLAGMSRRRAFAFALATTLTVELLQLAIPGRDSSIGDLLTNSIGGLAGILFADIWRVIILPSRRAAARLAGGWALLCVAVLTASAELAHISLPPTTAWGVWDPGLLQHDYFSGTVRSATAGGLPTPNAISGASADVRRRLSSDSVVVRATVIGGSPTPLIAAIATVYDSKQSEIFMLGERQGHLTFSLRMRSADARVATPAIRLDSIFARARSRRDTIEVAGGLIDRRLWISARERGVVRERTLPVDAGLGWSFFVPFDYELGAEAPWITALWLASLAAPGAYWAVRAGWMALFAMSALLAGGLFVVPLATSVHATPWWEWLGMVAGIAAGAVIGRATIRASRPL